jgi:hypothetical protein
MGFKCSKVKIQGDSLDPAAICSICCPCALYGSSNKPCYTNRLQPTFDFSQCLYGYFNHNPKRHLEFSKLTNVMETKGNKILRNIKTRWTSMINPNKWVVLEYYILLMKMALDIATIPST